MPDLVKAIDLSLVHWVGAAELEHSAAGVRPWRLPLAMQDFLEPRSRTEVGHPSGVRLRFGTNSNVVELEVVPHETSPRWFDLTQDERLLGRVTLEPGQSIVRFDGLPSGDKTLELWLHHLYAPVVVKSLRISQDASAKQVPLSTQKRILFYGSSISHGRQADGPTEAWTIGAARLAGLDPYNLGLGGACTLETSVARFIRDAQADYLSFCLGVNMVGSVTHSKQSFRSAVIGLLLLVREKHPTTPIAVQSPIHATTHHEHTPNAAGLNLILCREIIQEVVQTFASHGERHLHYTDGHTILGPMDAAAGCYMDDGVHPNGQGQRLMSRRWVEHVWPALQKLGK